MTFRPLLIILLASLFACQQPIGTVLNGQNLGAEGADPKVDGSTKEETTASEEDPLKSAGTGPSAAEPPIERSLDPSGPGPEGSQALADNRPIEPKNDEYSVTMIALDNARLRYGDDFSRILQRGLTTLHPGDPPSEFLVEFSGLRRPMNWYSLRTYNEMSQGPQVRLVFEPEGDDSQPVYCDAKWASNEEGRSIVVFPDSLEFGRGVITFYMNRDRYRQPHDPHIKHRKTPDFQTEGLRPLINPEEGAFPPYEAPPPEDNIQEGRKIMVMGALRTGAGYRILSIPLRRKVQPDQ